MRRRIAALLAGLALSGLALGGGTLSAAPEDAQPGHEKGPPVAHRVTLPPWTAVPLPDWATSVRIAKGDQPLLMRPDGSANRRGSGQREALLPLFGARFGPGCQAAWYHVGPRAWVCGDDVSLSGASPIAYDQPAFTATVDGLPFRYFFAGRDGSLAYRSLDEVDIGEPEMTLEPGFAVAIVEEQFVAGQSYGRTNRGVWVPMRDLGPARAFTFRGAELDGAPGGVIPVAWVMTDNAPVFAKHGAGFSPTGKRLARFTQVGFFERTSTFGGGYVRVGEGTWMRASDLRHPTVAPPPSEPEIGHGARWIDIELESQTLVAFEGETPVFATLVSTGKGKTKGHPFETPKGVHRIWVKLVTATMDNLENEYASRYYRIEDVPYVQFFHKGVGLHAAFWHRSFGSVRSHGCVNLAPLDAQRLFGWTGPRTPSGWTAALPTTHDRGTIIRVR